MLKLKEISNLLRKFWMMRARTSRLRASRQRNFALGTFVESGFPCAVPYDLQKFDTNAQNALHFEATVADKHFAPRRVLAGVQRTFRGTGLAELRAWRVSHARVSPPNQERAQ